MKLTYSGASFFENAAVGGLEISTWNSDSHSNEWIRINSKCRISSKPNYAKEKMRMPQWEGNKF